MKHSKEQIFATTQWAILYALLCRTNELNNKFVWTLIEVQPTVKGFASFIKKMSSMTEKRTHFEQQSFNQLIKPNIISQAQLNLFFNRTFTQLKRMRMSNKYHSRLNAQKAGATGFEPIEGGRL